MTKIEELRTALRAAFEWIDALPVEMVAALPAMPGLDRDWAESLLSDPPSDDN